jgi:hypothetical protein
MELPVVLRNVFLQFFFGIAEGFGITTTGFPEDFADLHELLSVSRTRLNFHIGETYHQVNQRRGFCERFYECA